MCRIVILRFDKRLTVTSLTKGKTEEVAGLADCTGYNEIMRAGVCAYLCYVIINLISLLSANFILIYFARIKSIML